MKQLLLLPAITVVAIVSVVIAPAATERALAAADSAIPAAGLYSITDLGALGGSAAFGLNEKGDVVGEMPNNHGFHYTVDSGALTDLGQGRATAVSDDGTVYGVGHGAGAGGTAVGVSPDGGTVAGSATSWPAIWSKAAGWRSLQNSGCRLPGLLSGLAFAVNPSGTLVGEAIWDADGVPSWDGIAAIAFKCTPDPSNPGTYTAKNLAPFGGAHSGAYAINRDGTAVGRADFGGGPDEAYLWGADLPRPLGLSAEGHPPADGSGSESAAYGINDSGDVVGSYGERATNPLAEAWGSPHNRAFLWSPDDQKMQDLTDLLPAGSPWTLNVAFDINNHGEIVGQGSVAGQLRAFLLTPNGNVNITADRIVVTQVIQNEENLDLLVAGKQTYAIVRVHSDTAAVPGVPAVLLGFRGGTSLGEIKPVSPPITVRQHPERDMVEQSFVFALDKAWTAEGNLTLEAKVNGTFKIPETKYTDNEPPPVSVTFLHSTAVKVVVVDPYFIGHSAPDIGNTVPYNNLRSLVGRLLPTATLDIHHEVDPVPISASFAWPDDQCGAVLKELLKVRKKMGLIGSNTFVYGEMAPNADGTSPLGNGVGGCAWVGDMVATGLTEWGTRGGYQVGATSDYVAAHELIHAIGRNHVGACGAVGADEPGYPGGGSRVFWGSLHHDAFGLAVPDFGFDGSSFLPAQSPADIMTYCNDQWMSDYTYENLYWRIRIASEDLVPQFPPLAKVVNIVGTIDLLDNSTAVSLRYAPLEAEPRAPVPGPYHIEFYNGATKLSDVGFTPVPMGPHASSGGELPQAVIDETVAMPAGADRMAIFDDQSGTEISSTSVGGSAPTVSVTSPHAGDQLPASGPLTVSWSAQDADSNSLTHSVLYRPADSAPWSVLANEVSGSSFTIDTAGLAGSAGGTVRVETYDGFNTARADVSGLRVPDKAPTVTIDSPADGTVITTEQALLLSGAANTVGSMHLPDSAFTWSSDRDGTLGSGPTLLANSLSVGIHHVVLRVTAPGGQVGQATTTVVVRAGGQTPSKLAVSFDKLAFSGTTTAPQDPQSFEVFDPSGSSLGWTATSDNPRVTLSAASGTTPATVVVSVNTSGLLGGQTLSAKVTVRRSDGSQEQPLVINVGAQSDLASASVSPVAIDLGRQALGTTGAPHDVTFTYNGPGQMTLRATTLAGADPAGYALSADQCSSATLASGQSCTVAVSFQPVSAGRRPAYVVLSDSDSPTQWYVSLTGLGAQSFTSKVVAWGTDEFGQLGAGVTSSACSPYPFDGVPCNPSPTLVEGLTDATEVASGGKHSLALKSDGTVWAWGQNDQGELGNGTRTPALSPYYAPIPHPHPQQVQGLADVTAIAAARNFSMALKKDGTVWAWGSSDGGAANGTTPVQVKGPGGVGTLTHVVAIALGSDGGLTAGIDAMALKDDGTVWTWGHSYGVTTPSQLPGPGGQGFLNNIVAIAYGMALRSDGTVWTWGYNGSGQLGAFHPPDITTSTNTGVPVQVLNSSGTAPLTGITAIAADTLERFALGPNGTVYAWGRGPTDQAAGAELGIGTGPRFFVSLPTPVLGPGGLGSFTGVADLQPGLAVTTDGAVWGWGNNDFGQVGAGTTTPGSAPVRVVGIGGSGLLVGVTKIAGGVDHHLAITSTGSGTPTTLTAGPPLAVTTTEGATFDESIASFDDSAPSRKAFSFAASVDWGDGTANSETVVTGPDGGPYDIHGGHTYARPGTYPLKIDVISRAGDSITLTGSASVADATLSPLAARDATFTAGAPSAQSLAQFSDSNPAGTETSFAATVDWGDGAAVSAATVSGPPGGPFSVNGEHTYRRAGTYPLVVHASDVDGAQITLLSNAIVAPALLTADDTFSTDLESGSSFSGPVASFRDGNPLSLPADYAADIDWGDGSRTAGSVSGPTGGPYTVAGSHTYAVAQPFTAKVTLTGPVGASATASTTLLQRAQHLSLTASVAPASREVPFDAVFSYLVRNDGTDRLWTVAVDGSICGPATPTSGDNGNGVLDAGETWTFTCRHHFDKQGTFTDVSRASAYVLLDVLPVRSGDVSTQVTAVRLDSTAPVVKVTFPAPDGKNGWFVHSPVTGTVTGDDPSKVSGIACTGATVGTISGLGTASASAPLSVVGDGPHTVTCSATDGAGNAGAGPGSIATATVRIDTTAPSVTCSASPSSLWPPGHKLVAVATVVSVDGGLSGPGGFTLTRTASSEPDNGLGDGDTKNDFQDWEIGTPDTHGLLRAERSGNGPGRIYTLTYTGADGAGNTASCAAVVKVPHDRGG